MKVGGKRKHKDQGASRFIDDIAEVSDDEEDDDNKDQTKRQDAYYKDTDLQKRTKFNVEDWEERYINQE